LSTARPVSATTPTQTPAAALPHELCPLCGAQLKPEQSWCLRCGAAARTRLAAQPKWKALAIVLVTAVVVSLGVLAAALVKLAG
jgi:predicted amidophosphoribosyltransferase